MILGVYHTVLLLKNLVKIAPKCINKVFNLNEQQKIRVFCQKM